MSEYYDNLGLFKDLSKCEEDLLEMINYNFFKLDSSWQPVVINIVDDLPFVASKGDAYILRVIDYLTQYYFAIYNGNAWVYVPVHEGYLFYSLHEGDFVFFDGFEFVPFETKYGNVKSFSYYGNNQVARFDGESGKTIKGSNVMIDDYGTITTPAHIYAETVTIEESLSVRNITLETYYGDPDVDGTWRVVVDNDNINFERRESGVWIWKQKITP